MSPPENGMIKRLGHGISDNHTTFRWSRDLERARIDEGNVKYLPL